MAPKLGKGWIAELCLNLTYVHCICSKLLCVSSDSIVAERSRASTWQEQRMVGNMVVVAVVIESVDEPSTYLMYVFPSSHSDAQLHFLI